METDPGVSLPEVPAAEAALVAALRQRVPAAFETLVRQYSGRLLSVARRLLGNDEDARDALQDAFVSAFRAVDGFDGQAKLSTWLHRIVVNASLMRLRSQRRKPQRSIDDLLPAFRDDGHQIDPPAPWLETSEQMLLRAETRQLVREAIDQLPENHRTVLLLRDIEQLDTETTAHLLAVSESVVKTRLHRARQALRALLDPHFRREDAE